MVSGGVSKCIKYALFLFNLAFVGIGITLVAVGVTTLNRFKYFALVESGSFGAPPKLFIAIGVIMFLIAFLGCCGACMENHAMIMAYSVLVGLVLILQLGVGIAAYLLADDVEGWAHNGLNKTLHEYHNKEAEGYDDIRRSWDMVQMDFKCCGINNYTDWQGTLKGVPTPPETEPLVPISCCIGGAAEHCTKDINDDNILDPTKKWENVVFNEGCLHKAVDNLNITRIGYVGISLGVIELLGVLCACLLARSIRFSYETV